MHDNLYENEKIILRELAKKQMEYAARPEMLSLAELWIRHNDLRGERPLFTIEIGTFQHEIPHEHKCVSETGRRIEAQFWNLLDNYEFIGDDWVVPPFYPVYRGRWLRPFDIEAETRHAENSFGFEFVQKIFDLENEVDSLKKSAYYISGSDELEREIDLYNDAFGDILPVRPAGASLYSGLTYDIVHLMGMENMFLAMYDAPDAFHKMMDKLSDDYVEFFTQIQERHMLLHTTSYGVLDQGSLCYNSTLPGDEKPAGGLRLSDVWGYMDSQETVGVSTPMFEEFIFPYYKKVAGLFGLLSYGCCEPVHTIYDSCLTKLPNLRKLSISAWCDERMMGERLRGGNTIYYRKPSPNFIGVGKELDEDAWRAHILETLQAAKGCHLEFAQRDVYTLGGNIGKLRRAAEIAREMIESVW